MGTDLDRRRLLKAGVLLLPGCGGTQPAHQGQQQGFKQHPSGEGAAVPIVDAHVHCFAGPSDPRFPYHALAPYRPGEAATPEQLLAAMDDAGVAFAVIVHPEPYQDDHRYLEHCLAVGAGRLKGTALVFCDRPGSAATLPGLVKRAPVAAVRIHAYQPDRQPPFGSAELDGLWKMASDLGLMVQLHFEPRYAPGFANLIAKYPGTTVILDHLGRPFQGTPEEHAVILGWARYPNTVIKLSAVPEPHEYPHRDIRPVVRSIVREFGPRRILYGGGFGAGATGATYRAKREQYGGLVDFLGPEDRQLVFGGNAARLFEF